MPARCRLLGPTADSLRPAEICAARSRAGGQRDPAEMRIGAHVLERRRLGEREAADYQ